MKLPFLLQPSARREYLESAEWYERKEAGLASRFIEAVDERLDLIASDPLRFPVAKRDARVADVPGFPFAIYYRIENETFFVFSVFHVARDPANWEERI